MKILNHEVPLGISITRYGPDDVNDFVKLGFTHFEIGIPNALEGDTEPLYGVRCRGHQEETVAAKQPIADRIFEHGLRVWSVHLPFGEGWDIAHCDEAERDAVCASLRRVIDLTACWGTRVYVIHGCLEPVETEERALRIARSIRSLRELNEYASQYGAQVALENLPRTCLANNSLETRAMVQASGNIPVCFDVNHLLGESHASFLSALADRIVTTHLSDYDGIDERHELPGTGIVPWREVFIGLLNAGYRGPFLFELKPGDDGHPYPAQKVLDSFLNAMDSQ